MKKIGAYITIIFLILVTVVNLVFFDSKICILLIGILVGSIFVGCLDDHLQNAVVENILINGMFITVNTAPIFKREIYKVFIAERLLFLIISVAFLVLISVSILVSTGLVFAIYDIKNNIDNKIKKGELQNNGYNQN